MSIVTDFRNLSLDIIKANYKENYSPAGKNTHVSYKHYKTTQNIEYHVFLEVISGM